MLESRLFQYQQQAWTALGAVPGFPLDQPAPGVGLVTADARAWLAAVPAESLHAVVTDPPYGLIEFEPEHQAKLRRGRGGVWRRPPRLGGVARAPLPRFTVLTAADRERLRAFFDQIGRLLLPALVPGGHLMVAANPLLSTTAFGALEAAGFEKRGEIIRLVQTLRGGDRPKGAESEFAEVTVMPRSGWEPWGLFRKPLSEATVAANLRRWGTGALRRVSPSEPFRDVIASAPTRPEERALAPHPALKPQQLMRQLVRAALPLGLGVICDPFAGAGSTLAAAAHLGLHAIGSELDPAYAGIARQAIPALSALR